MEDFDVEDEEEKKIKEEVIGGEDVKGIFEFWLIVLKNYVFIVEIIFDWDEEVFKYFVDVWFFYFDGEKFGFKFYFVFIVNEFFEDVELIKIYYY